jgi:TPR repeat protein
LTGADVALFDFAQARQLFEQGAALGEASAMNRLGAMYNDGDGVARNTRGARQWFENAAALGNPRQSRI